MNAKDLFVGLMLFQLSLSISTAQSMDSLIHEYVVEKNSWTSYLIRSDSSISTDSILNGLSYYNSHEKENSRYRAYILTYDLLSRQGTKAQLDFLLNTVYADSSYTIRDALGRRLVDFTRKEYDEELIESVEEIAANDAFVNEKIVLVIGYLNLTTNKDRLFELTSEKYKTIGRIDVKKAAKLALARMGEQVYLNSLMSEVRQASDFDNLIYNIKQLAYVQQDQATDFIVQLLMSNKRLPPVHSEIGEIYAYRPSKILRRLLENTPEKAYSNGKNMQYIEQMRKWIKSQNGKWEYNRDNFW